MPPDEPGLDRHWLSPAEITRRFAAFPEAVAATGQLAARCGPALPDGRPLWPVLKLPANQSPAERLAELAEIGLAGRYSEITPAIRQRLQTELTTITRHGFAPLFVIVADLVAFARQGSAGQHPGQRGQLAGGLLHRHLRRGSHRP